VRLIAGLGNPGKEYRLSRHNFGFMVVDRLAKAYKIRYFWPRYQGRAAKVRIGEEEVMLLKPHTYMNLSGNSVAAAMKRLNLYTEQLVVIHDDLDLELGTIKIGFGLKSAGHKGLESIIEQMKTNDFYRIRLGIGKPENKAQVVDYVLMPFAKQDSDKVQAVIEEACSALEVLIKDGLEKAQNIYNQRK
jgi:peptidyl-tRNA hydrolase, PTH1 family